MNGVSKKLCISILGIQAIVQMSTDAENKLIYACLIVGIVVVYKGVQALMDWLNRGER